MGVTALIAAGVGAAGSIGSAVIGAGAANNASNAQVTQQEKALQQQQSMFNIGQQALNPFIAYGQGNIPTLNNLLTPGSSAATLASMPGFAFQSQYGTMAATNALSAKTGASAGPLATAISQYNNGLAGTQYFNTVGALQNSVNTGANAAGSLLTGAINSGNAQASTLGNVGNAQASGILGSAGAISNGINGLTGSANNALLYNALGSNNAGGGLYSANALTNGPSNSAISNMSNAQADQYESMFG